MSACYRWTKRSLRIVLGIVARVLLLFVDLDVLHEIFLEELYGFGLQLGLLQTLLAEVVDLCLGMPYLSALLGV